MANKKIKKTNLGDFNDAIDSMLGDTLVASLTENREDIISVEEIEKQIKRKTEELTQLKQLKDLKKAERKTSSSERKDINDKIEKYKKLVDAKPTNLFYLHIQHNYTDGELHGPDEQFSVKLVSGIKSRLGKEVKFGSTKLEQIYVFDSEIIQNWSNLYKKKDFDHFRGIKDTMYTSAYYTEHCNLEYYHPKLESLLDRMKRDGKEFDFYNYAKKNGYVSYVEDICDTVPKNSTINSRTNVTIYASCSDEVTAKIKKLLTQNSADWNKNIRKIVKLLKPKDIIINPFDTDKFNYLQEVKRILGLFDKDYQDYLDHADRYDPKKNTFLQSEVDIMDILDDNNEEINKIDIDGADAVEESEELEEEV